MIDNIDMNSIKLPENFWKDKIHFLALGFGSGLCPIMPGTCGTLAAIPIYLILQFLPLTYYFLVLAAMIGVGFWLCDKTSRDLRHPDPGPVVWDEIVGYLLTMAAAPLNWRWVILGFVFFRIFDIWKPFPVSWFNNRFHNGFGIVADDLVAAVYAWLLLNFIILIR